MNLAEMLDRIEELTAYLPHDARVVIQSDDGTEFDINEIKAYDEELVFKA